MYTIPQSAVLAKPFVPLPLITGDSIAIQSSSLCPQGGLFIYPRESKADAPIVHEGNSITVQPFPLWPQGGLFIYPCESEAVNPRSQVYSEHVTWENQKYKVTRYSDGAFRWLNCVPRGKNDFGDKFVRTEFKPTTKYPLGGFFLTSINVDRWAIRKKTFAENVVTSQGKRFLVTHYSDGSQRWMRYKMY